MTSLTGKNSLYCYIAVLRLLHFARNDGSPVIARSGITSPVIARSGITSPVIARARSARSNLRTGSQQAAQSQKKGFTLIEIMVSVAVLAIGLVLILQGFAHSLNALRISEDNLKAAFAADNKLAEAQIQAKEDWDDFKKGLDEEFKFEDIKCTWEVEITPVEWELEEEVPESYEDLNEVKATLSWKEGKRKGTIPFVTYMRSNVEAK